VDEEEADEQAVENGQELFAAGKVDADGDQVAQDAQDADCRLKDLGSML
jgi:hypothetical protein